MTLSVRKLSIAIVIVILIILSLVFKIVKSNNKVKQAELKYAEMKQECDVLKVALDKPAKTVKPKTVYEKIVETVTEPDYSAIYELFNRLQGKPYSETDKVIIEFAKEIGLEVIVTKERKIERVIKDEGSETKPIYPTFTKISDRLKWRLGFMYNFSDGHSGIELGRKLYKFLNVEIRANTNSTGELGFSIGF